MGHVDHPEQAEGDRQAEGGEQQDRAQRQAAESLAEQFADQELALDLRQAGLGGLAHVGVGFRLVGQQVLQAHPRHGRAGFAEQAHRGEAYCRIIRGQLQVGQRQGQRFADGGIVLGVQALLKQLELLRLAAALQALGRGEALRGVFGEQLVARQGGVEQAAQAVVQTQLLRRADRLGITFEGTVGPVFLDEGRLVLVDGHAIGAQRFDQRQPFRRGRGGPAFQQPGLFGRAGLGVVGRVSGLGCPGQNQQEQQQ